jgi:peptide deformylase
MILPIVAYGHPNLRNISEDIGPDYPGLKELIADMFETMAASSGVGLAAPQINRSIRLFIIDANHYSDDYPAAKGFRKIFINPYITETMGTDWVFNEGCLSVPEIREDISRKTHVRIRYVDENFKEHEEVYDGILSRIIQHEYDHLEGILFVDKVGPLKKVLLKGKLSDITKGYIKPNYKMIYPVLKKKRT